MRIRKKVNIEDSEEAIFIAKIANVFAHPVRVALFSYVKTKNKVSNHICNKDLVEHFNYSQSSLSQHVKKMVEANIFNVEYKEKFSIYSINEKVFKQYLKYLAAL